MKKFSLLLAITLLTSFVGLTQSSVNKCNCPTEAELKRVLIAAEQGKTCKERVIILEQNIAIYDERIKNLSDVIKVYEGKDSTYNDIVDTYKREIELAKEARSILEKALVDQKAYYEKELKKEKRKRFWTTVGGIATTVASAFIFSR